MITLGINFSNNGSICVLKDGELDLYLESERISGFKYDTNIESLFSMLPEADRIAFVDSDWSNSSKNAKTFWEKQQIKKKFPNAKIFDYAKEHHKCHSECALVHSGFDDAVSIVVDGNGSRVNNQLEIESIFYKDQIIHKKYYSPEDWGIGKYFEWASTTCGFDKEDAGKIMGLSAYGTKNIFPLNYYFPGVYTEERNPDISFTIQKMGEQRGLELINLAIEKTGCKNVVLSGGFFLNCVANYYYRKNLPNDAIMYVEPIAHDGGTAIGAAYLANKSK